MEGLKQSGIHSVYVATSGCVQHTGRARVDHVDAHVTVRQIRSPPYMTSLGDVRVR